MANNLYINGVERALKPGWSHTKKLNTELDTALVMIPKTEEFAIEPMDEARIDTTYFYVSTIRRRIASFTPVKKWNYEIGLVSPTIRLQRIILPNRSITQRFRGTKLTIYDMLLRYKSIYAPWATFSSALQEKTENVICPEFQWTQPTLFEVFNDLLKVVNCVVTMPNYTQISVLDLAERGDEIDTTKLNDMEVFQSVDEYASKLEIDAKNAVYPEANIQTYEWLVLKTTQSNLMTTENAELILAKPIYQIEKIECIFYDDGAGGQLTADITDYIVEKKIYNTYKSSNTLNVISDKTYKRNALYYEEGKNIIGGFGYNEDGILGINTRPAINNILTDKLGLSIIELNANQMFEYGFRVWYISSEDVKFRVEGDKKNTAMMINNQESSHTDLRALARSNQDTVQRIGQPLTTVYARNYTPNIGDTMGDYVVTSVTKATYADYTEMSAELTENYVMENMFTAIKNRKRYQQYESATEAFLSEHITEYDVNITTVGQSLYSDFERFLIQMAKKDYRLKAVVANVAFSDSTTEELVLNHSAHWLGTNAIRVNVRMDDNYSAGIRLEREDVFYVSSRYSAIHTPYVDANGEFDFVELLLYKDFSNPNFAFGDGVSNDEALERARQLPLVTEGLNLYPTDIIFDTNPLWRYKDNREITSETLQFYFNAHDDVVLSDLFYRHNPLLYQGDTDIDLYVFYSTAETYEDGDVEAKGTLLDIVVRSSNAMRAGVTLEEWNALGVMSWGIADADGNLYIGVNSDARYVWFVSGYDHDAVTYTINGISIGGMISAEYTAGDHYDVDSISIGGTISASYESGLDAFLEDVEISGYISAGYSGGDHVTLNSIVITGIMSSEYESGYDPSLTNISISGVISAELVGVAPDSYTVIDVSIDGLISAEHIAYAPDSYTISDISIGGVISAGYTYSAPISVTLNDVEIVGILTPELTYSYWDYVWVSGGTSPSGGTACDGPSDVGNIQCDLVCVFEEYDSYVSFTNDSNSVSCVIGDTSKITCTRTGPTSWLCTIYEGVYGYANCKTCTYTEVEG